MIRKVSSSVRVEIAQTITNIRNKKISIKHANFEDAIKATGFGKFNIVLLCLIVPGSFAQIVEQTSSAYVIPIAQCDLNLSLEQKGLLVSISYTGMILSAFLWGYISDTYGRKKVIVYGFIGNAACYILTATSQNFISLLVTKFLSGFIYTGPFAAFTSYLSEFHSTENRSRVQLMRGIGSAIAVIVLPMVAWLILPHVYNISIIEGISLHSWNLFVAVCSIPALTTGIVFMFMPESPKFLMASGKTMEALTVFKEVYSKNTGRPFSSFPIKSLEEKRPKIEYKIESETSLKEKLLSGFTSMKPLFKPPYLMTLLHISSAGALSALGGFSVKMWYPQILQSMNDFQDTSKADICPIIDSLANQNTSESAVCTVNLDNSSVYINACVLGAVQLVAFLLAGVIINRTGKKALAVTMSFIDAACPMLIYLIPNTTVMLSLFPLIIALTEVYINIFLTITMEVFPTTFRSTALNLILMSNRFGIFSGNVALPYILKTGCLPTLGFVSAAILAASVLTAILPNTDNKDLE